MYHRMRYPSIVAFLAYSAFARPVQDVAKLHAQAKFTMNEESGPELNGKRLTVNFAKARPCTEDQLQRLEEGARSWWGSRASIPSRVSR